MKIPDEDMKLTRDFQSAITEVMAGVPAGQKVAALHKLLLAVNEAEALQADVEYFAKELGLQGLRILTEKGDPDEIYFNVTCEVHTGGEWKSLALSGVGLDYEKTAKLADLVRLAAALSDILRNDIEAEYLSK